MKEITLKAVIENIPLATAFVDEALEEVGCSMKAQMQIDVAMDELFCNVARYADGSEEGDATVQFDFDMSTRTASITLIDSGKPFDPLSVTEPDTTSSAADRPIGGLGIFLVRKTMDEMSYQYLDGRNRLTIRKRV